MRTSLISILLFILLLSCQSPTNSSSSNDDQNQTVHNPYRAINYSYPIPVEKISLGSDGIDFSWGDVSDRYRVTVTDSLGTKYVNLLTNRNRYSLSEYEENKDYLVSVRAVFKTYVFKTDLTKVDTGFANVIVVGDSAGVDVGDYFGTSADTIMDGFILSPSQDSSKFFVVKSSTDSLSFSINTEFKDSTIDFIKDTSLAVSFRTEFFHSPESLSVALVADTLTLKWKQNSSALGYIAYLYDIYGSIVDSVITTSNSAGFTLTDNKSYKVNVATLSSLGVGSLDSIYPVDTTTADGVDLSLPYIYVTTEKKDFDTLDLISVPGGIFLMGDITKKDASALPLHEVYLSPFYIGRTEVSSELYCTFLNSRDSLISFSGDSLLYRGYFIVDTSIENWFISYSSDSLKFIPESSRENFPVAGVSWAGAVAYCNMRSDLESLTRCYNEENNFSLTLNNGYRLPTEAEFEYTASGSMDGNKSISVHSLGASVSDSLQPVDSGIVNYGIYNIFGNVYEWVNDFADGISSNESEYYLKCKENGVSENPTGPLLGSAHILRGGSYNSPQNEYYAAHRYRFPYIKRGDFGFRIARNN